MREENGYVSHGGQVYRDTDFPYELYYQDRANRRRQRALSSCPYRCVSQSGCPHCSSYLEDEDDGYERDDEGRRIFVSFERTTRHTARRDHKDGKVKRGDYYSRTVRAGYHEGGPRWMRIEKRVIESAPQALI